MKFVNFDTQWYGLTKNCDKNVKTIGLMFEISWIIKKVNQCDVNIHES